MGLNGRERPFPFCCTAVAAFCQRKAVGFLCALLTVDRRVLASTTPVRSNRAGLPCRSAHRTLCGVVSSVPRLQWRSAAAAVGEVVVVLGFENRVLLTFSEEDIRVRQDFLHKGPHSLLNALPRVCRSVEPGMNISGRPFIR